MARVTFNVTHHIAVVIVVDALGILKVTLLRALGKAFVVAFQHLLVLEISISIQRGYLVLWFSKFLVDDVFLLLPCTFHLFREVLLFIGANSLLDLLFPGVVATLVAHQFVVRDGELHRQKDISDLFFEGGRIVNE